MNEEDEFVVKIENWDEVMYFINKKTKLVVSRYL